MTSLRQVFAERLNPAAGERLAVIDIGSNSVRLVVYESATRAAVPLFNEKILCGLGRSVASTGHLGPESINRALKALQRFKSINRILKVRNVKAIATAAVREAKDGADFIAKGEKAAGAAIEVLSGEREAQLAGEGIRMGFFEADGVAGDLGGGSLELIDIRGATQADASTLPLGGLRLIDQTGDKIDKAVEIVDQQIAKLAWLAKGRGRPFYAVGGTWRALARLHMDQSSYALRVMQGYTVPTRAMTSFCESLRRTRKLSEIAGIGEVTRARREVLPYGALVLERLLKQLQPSEVVFSVFGIREGLLYSMLPPGERRKDPLLSFCEDFSRLRSRSVEHAHELCDWTDALFTRQGPAETPEERRLRHAACLLSDIGWRAHPDYRGEQSLDKIAHAGLAGIDHPGRIFLALAVYFRHAGADTGGHAKFPELLIGAVNRRVQKRARIVGAALRTAHMVSIGMPGVIGSTPLSYHGQKLVLTLPRRYADLDGERLDRRLDALARLVDRTGDVRLA